MSKYTTSHTQDYKTLVSLFWPELVTAFILYSLLQLIEAWFIGQLHSTSTYATLGVVTTLQHFLIKIAEGLSVGTLIICGRYNGLQEFEEAGQSFNDAFWTTVVVGGLIALTMYCGAYWIFYLFGVPAKMIDLGIPFLRLRAVGIFFNFVYFAFIGFLRSVKNTRAPMIFFLLGAPVFLFFDYALIFGAWGFPEMKLQGTAIASILQYAVMTIAALLYTLYNPKYRAYNISLQRMPKIARVKEILKLSWPVMVDKASFASSYMWLTRVISPLGKHALASYGTIKDMQRVGLLPAVAFAQVTTLLVTNQYGLHKWTSIINIMKKATLLSIVGVALLLTLFSLWPAYFVGIFDPKGTFTDLAAFAFPTLSLLALFDVVQLILSAGLRGAADVKTVMWVRILVFLSFFIPSSYFVTYTAWFSPAVQFLLVYALFYISNGFMGIIYLYRLKGKAWKKHSIEEQ